MADDITTSLTAQLQRAVSAVADNIARSGLELLQKTLDNAGFLKSSYLKDYEVYSRVNRDTITFEILVRLDSIQVDQMRLAEKTREQEMVTPKDTAEQAEERVFGIQGRGGFANVARMHDARKPTRDARKPLRDARKPLHDATKGPRDSRERAINHTLARTRPRSILLPRGMQVNRDGKLAIQLDRRATLNKEGGLQMPNGEFQGIVRRFMDDLRHLVLEQFTPQLEKIISGYLS